MSTTKLTTSQIAQVRAAIGQAQGNRCAICFRPLDQAIPTLDHNHATGFCRGVLCNNCNGMEGRITKLSIRAKYNLSNLQWLKNLVAYLEFHRVARTTFIHPTHKTPEEKRLAKNAAQRKKRAATGGKRGAK